MSGKGNTKNTIVSIGLLIALLACFGQWLYLCTGCKWDWSSFWDLTAFGYILAAFFAIVMTVLEVLLLKYVGELLVLLMPLLIVIVKIVSFIARPFVKVLSYNGEDEKP